MIYNGLLREFLRIREPPVPSVNQGFWTSRVSITRTKHLAIVSEIWVQIRVFVYRA